MNEGGPELFIANEPGFVMAREELADLIAAFFRRSALSLTTRMSRDGR